MLLLDYYTKACYPIIYRNKGIEIYSFISPLLNLHHSGMSIDLPIFSFMNYLITVLLPPPIDI